MLFRVAAYAPVIRETASVVHRRALDEDLLPGRSIEGVATASLYAAGLVSNEEVTQKQASDVANVSEVTIRNRYRELLSDEHADGEAPA